MGIGQGLFVVKGYRHGTTATDLRVLSSAGTATCAVQSDTNIVWTATSATVQRWNGSSFVSASVALPGGANVFEPISFPDGTTGTLFTFSSSAATNNQTITFHFDVFTKLRTITAGPPANAYRNLLDACIDGGRIDVTLSDGNGTLRLHLRSLLTGDYLLQNNILQPAHHPLAVGTANNFPFINGEAAGTYTVGLTNYDLPTTLAPLGAVSGLQNNLTLDLSDGAPNDEDNGLAMLSLSRAFPGDPSDTSINPATPTTNVPIQVHVPTQLILLLDRSGSMGVPLAAGGTKWDAATSIASLFTKLYNHLIPERTAAAGTLRSQYSVKFGHFTWSGGAENVVFEPVLASDFPNASTMPNAPGGIGPGGGTPIGIALRDSATQLNVSNKWSRRIVVLLTDGMDNSGTPSVATITSGQFPGLNDDSGVGVILHSISYARTGETPVMQLSTLASSHDGQFQATAADLDSYSASALRGAFLSLLANVLPSAHSQPAGGTVVAEAGLDKLVLVTTQPGPLVAVSDPSGTPVVVAGTTTGSVANFSWIVIPSPTPGVEYGLQTTPAGAEVHAFYDLSVRSRFGIDASNLGEPLKLWAEIQNQGEPVSGADVRARLAFPNESAGEVSTQFVRTGGLRTAVQRKTLDPTLLALSLQATNLNAALIRATQPFVTGSMASLSTWSAVSVGPSRAGASAARAAAAGTVDVRAVAAQLLTAAEAARHLPFQYGHQSIRLQEVAPGRYEATIPAEQVRYAGVHSADFRVDGFAGGFPFERNHRVCALVAEPPSPAHSTTGLFQSSTQPGVWVATVTPVNALGQPLGPGLATFASFQYVDPKARKDERLQKLITVDNLDGSYSTFLQLPEGKVPEVAFFYGDPDRGAPGIVAKPQVKTVNVRVRLDSVEILDDKDPLFKGAGEFVFTAVVAPNASPTRAVQTRLPRKDHYAVSSGKQIDVKEVIYEGVLEVGSQLHISIAGEELDWPACLDANDPLTRYSRAIAVPKATKKFTPDDEQNDLESMRDWRVWYTVEVS